ncbi:hypothetical protein A9Q78_02140 [Methylophaga sp. 41_12_T18]|nr:hypothetical protein A9Q78_02140 [Methylophaga sp. 41_12_T18]
MYKIILRLLLPLLCSFPVFSEEAADSAEQQNVITNDDPQITVEQGIELLPDIEVLGVKDSLSTIVIDRTKSSTILGEDEIKRRQAGTIMELVDDVAGVTIEGGVRSNGMNFNIRGFSNNEDILKVVDGARQNFERYRYGSGLDIDPALLKQVEVIRGSNIRTAGSGTIGGAVIMTTKNARDMLAPGEDWGARLHYGHRSNNDQNKTSTSFYGQPLEFADVLVNAVYNDSNDITLANGDNEDNSANRQKSVLTKIGLFGDDYELDLGFRWSDETGLEPFDAVAGIGVGGYVVRTRRTKSPTANLNWNPDSDWLNVNASLAYNDQFVMDEDSAIAAGGTDIVSYKITNFELRNTSDFYLAEVDGQIEFGLQASRERREYIRISQAGVAGFNETQPPGEKESYGAYLQTELNWQDWSVTSGVRYDDYAISAGGATEQALIEQDREQLKESDFDRVGFSAGLNYQPKQGPVTLFYNYNESFRAPLINEFYGLGSFSYCSAFNIFAQQPVQADYAVFNDYINALNSWGTNPLNSGNSSCAGLFEPETATTHEIGFSTQWLDSLDIDLTTKVTYFQIRTENLIESIYQNSVTGDISQDGEEFREGWELEASYDSLRWFASVSISILDGYVDYNYYDNNIDTRVQPLQAGVDSKIDLFNVPGDSLSMTIGHRLPKQSLEFGYRLKAVSSRNAVNGVDNSRAGCSNVGSFTTVPACQVIEKQPGYATHSIFMTWLPFKDTSIGLTVTNLTNKEYNTQGSGGSTGLLAAGRDIRVSFEQSF